MVLANVAAAEALEKLRLSCMYRIHAPPSDEKMEALRSFLHGMSVSLPPQGQIHPRDLDAVLKQVADTEAAPLVNEVVLRSQSQAQYSPDNIGHFGLACRATPISPARSAAMPISASTARSSGAWARGRTG